MTFLKNNIFLLFVLLFSVNTALYSQESYNPLLVNEELVFIDSDVMSFSTYCNERFDFCMQYPKELLQPSVIPTNNDGQIFISEDGNMTLKVFGSHQLHWTLSEEMGIALHRIEKRQDEADHISHKILTDEYFEIAGIVDGKHHYQKTFEDSGQFITLIFESEFAPLQAEMMEEVREEIIDSFDM